MECATLDRLVDDVRAGRSSVLVLRGESGHGKTALLDYAHGQASGCRVARVVGVDSEMELAFAGLHQLCAPMLDRLDDLPGPQQHALRVAFGLSGGEAPDRYLVGLAVLTLLSDMATEQPLVCVVDDAQWLDRASVQSLAFAARRLLADPVGMVFAVACETPPPAVKAEHSLSPATRPRCCTTVAGTMPPRSTPPRRPASTTTLGCTHGR